MRPVFALLLLALTGCLEAGLVPCGEQLCPVNATCVAGEICARTEQLDACEGLADGDECTFSGGRGRCDRGVCIGNTCGNGMLNPGEACDDGNEDSGDGCRADCLKVEECGDTVVDDLEGCDDGNDNPADGCDACVPMTWQASVQIGGNANATAAGLGRPNAVAIDRNGNIYIADTGNHRVRRVDVTGVITVIAGTGIQGYSGDGGLGPAAQLNQPAGVAVDGLGNVYVADTWNSRVRRISANGVITTVAGTGTPGYTGDDVPATTTRLGFPAGVAVDGLGTLYIADGARVRRVDLNGIITTFAGDGTFGFGGDDGPATSAKLAGASSVALDSLGNVYIAETAAHIVRKVDTGGTIRRVAGQSNMFGYVGDNGPATSARLHSPEGVTVDASGNVYIADTYNDVIRRVSPAGTITTLATGLFMPRGVGVDSAGTVYAVDTNNNRVRRVDGSSLTTVAGTGASGFAGDGGAATSARLGLTSGMTTDSQGNLYVVDNENHRLRKIAPSGVITTLAGGSASGYAGDGGPAIDAVLNSPRDVVVDGAGNIYISDGSNDRVRRIDSAGIITTFAGTGTGGYNGDDIDATQAQLQTPTGLALDAQGNLYISDSGNHRIRKVDTSGIISTVAGSGTGGFSGDGYALYAQIYYPQGLAFDSAGNLFIADGENHRIRKLDSTQTLSTIAGVGTRGYDGDGGPAIDASLQYPTGLDIDAGNNLYIADTSNCAIRKITGTTITTIAGGTNGATGDGAAATSATLSYPQGVVVHQGLVHFTDDRRAARIEANGALTTVAGAIDPEGMGPLPQARLADARALVISAPWSIVAGGATGTVQLARTDTGWLETVAGRYPQVGAIGARARYRGNAFGDVSGVAFDAATGRIYFTEANTIHVITTTANPADASTWTIETFANSAGTAGFSDGLAANAKFRAPTGLYLDVAANDLLVVDTGNHAVRAISLTTGMTRTLAGTPGIRGKSGDGGPALDALLYEPRAVTRCGNGDLFIADTNNQRVARVAGTTITTVIGDGTAASSGEGGPATTFPVDKPLGLVCDAVGNLFVTSTSTVRLLPANASGVVDGTGSVQTIYGRAPADTFPESVSRCLTGIAIVDATTVAITDACAGVLVSLHRQPK